MLEGVDAQSPLQEDFVNGGRTSWDGAQVVGQLGQTPIRPAFLLPVPVTNVV